MWSPSNSQVDRKDGNGETEGLYIRTDEFWQLYLLPSHLVFNLFINCPIADEQRINNRSTTTTTNNNNIFNYFQEVGSSSCIKHTLSCD
jgi:hypothetical protein